MKKKLTAAILAAVILATATSAYAATPEDEINELKTRLAKLEASLQTVEKKQTSAAKAPNIAITGESRLRYQWGDHDPTHNVDGTNAFDLRQRFYLSAKINDHVSYNGRLEGTMTNGSSTTGTMRFNRNYFTVTDVGVDKLFLGRMPVAAGMSLNIDKGVDNDGFVLIQKAGDVTFTGFVLDEAANAQFNGIYAGASLSKDVDMVVGYTEGDSCTINGIPYARAKSFDIGVAYKFGKDYTAVGEFVDTSNADLAGVEDGNAWAVQVVKGLTTKKVGTLTTNLIIVDKDKPHTEGYIASYRRVEPNGLWARGYTSPFNNNNSVLTTTDNIKGIYLGYQNVVVKNTVFTLEYQDLKNVSGVAYENKIFQSHVQFFF